MAVGQQLISWLTHRHREQAPSHMFPLFCLLEDR